MIILYKGARGTSKTLSMVKDGLKFHKAGWVVYTNLHNTRFENVTSDYILNLNSMSKLNNAVLCIDEIELFFDSREWNTNKSKLFSKFLQQIRKRNVIILCTAQFTNLIDIRLRQQIDILCFCSYDKGFFISTNVYYDITSFESGKTTKIAKVSYYAKPFFKEYNTLELIK